jgi:hypothetical protein
MECQNVMVTFSVELAVLAELLLFEAQPAKAETHIAADRQSAIAFFIIILPTYIT